VKLHVRRAPRSAPRSEITAHALYLLASCAGPDWAACRVVDVSDFGARLELRGPWPKSSRELMLLRIVAPATQMPVTFCAALVHQTITERGTLCVGVEFVDAPVPEQGREWGWRSSPEPSAP
jgi:hypothetical protein